MRSASCSSRRETSDPGIMGAVLQHSPLVFWKGEYGVMEKPDTIKAIFSDVDGTLLNSAHRVTPRTGMWIRRVMAQDIPFVIVSARSPSGIYPILKRNDLECALIAYSGAMILDRDRSILFNRQIRRDLAAEIEYFFITSIKKKYDMTWSVYSGDLWLAPDRRDPRILREERIVEARSREGSVRDLVPGAGVNKFLCICAPEQTTAIEREIRGAFPEVFVVRSSDILIEIMDRGTSKADAVRRFCEYAGILPEETIAFGDHYNDVEMLGAVGQGYVMGNAPEEIRRQFGRVTADNDHDGIADVLERLFGT